MSRLRAAVAALSAVAACSPARAQAPAIPVIPAPPEVRVLLTATVATYRKLRSLRQETTYTKTSTVAAAASLVSALFEARRPNRMVLEVRARTPGFTQPAVTRFVCDGRWFYTYQQVANNFTEAPAPKDFVGLQTISPSLEVAAFTGLDIGQALLEESKSMKLEADETSDGVLCHVLAADMSDPVYVATTRIAIGKEDHLIRRFSFDAVARPLPPREKRPPEPDPDNPGEFLIDEDPLPPADVHFAYENRVEANPKLPDALFAWVQPKDAMRFHSLTDLMNTPEARKASTPRKKKRLTLFDQLHGDRKR